MSKEFPGGLLVMTGANSAVGLRSMAARDLFLDEVDAYPLDVDGEGDPISLAMARTRTFARRKIFLASTPIDEGTSRIQKAYEGSDQRHYFVPCPFCNHFQILTFERIRWAPGYPDTAAYYCESCERRIDNHYKTVMLERGEWRATAPGDGRTAGFHLPSYYSPVGWFSFSDAAAMWERADRLNDDSMRKVFVNTVDAKTWRTRGDAPDWKRIYERAQAEDLPKDGTVPLRGLFLTAGADVQKDRIEIQVIAWGRGKESWLIDHHILPGDPSRPEVWDKLTEYSNRTFIHKTGLDLPIVRLAIDSGDQTQTVYAWVRTQGPGRVLAVKGFDNGNAIVGTPSAVDLNWQGKKLRRAVKLWPVNVSALKVEFYGWLKLDSPTEESGRPFPAGYCHFPPMNEEFFKQLTAEQLVTKIVKGYQKTEWQKVRDRNEALDCRIYGRAAASQFGMDRFSSRDWDFLEGPIHEAVAAQKAQEKQAAEQAAGVPAPPGPAPVRVAPQSGWLPKKTGWFDK
jgi:phage terminase large subunit GpA-like protein